MIRKVVDVFEPCVSLELATKEYVQTSLDDAAAGEGSVQCAVLEMEPQPEWSTWLETIAENVNHHINPPAALAPGHRTLSHKAAARAFGWALIVPDGPQCISKHSDTYAGATSDLGLEKGFTSYDVENGDVERLLPEWLDKTTPPHDLPVAEAEQAEEMESLPGLDGGDSDADVIMSDVEDESGVGEIGGDDIDGACEESPQGQDTYCKRTD